MLWIESFPNLVESATKAWYGRRYLEAARAYLWAAHVAPDPEWEARMLRASWIASERAAGRVSQLENPETEAA